MKWLKRKLRNWINEPDYEGGDRGMAVSSMDDTNRPDTDPILTFRIYSATNGKVLEFRRYDRKTDRNDNSTYIIEKIETLASMSASV